MRKSWGYAVQGLRARNGKFHSIQAMQDCRLDLPCGISDLIDDSIQSLNGALVLRIAADILDVNEDMRRLIQTTFVRSARSHTAGLPRDRELCVPQLAGCD